jgi:hypothetical protein
MSPRFARKAEKDSTGHAAEALLSPLFDVADREERRILSWSPDPLEEPEPEPEPEPELPPAAAVTPLPVPVRAPEPVAELPKKRGRPRSKTPRRQVHFHVDPEEERLLLAAARTFGSQQKGIIAALQSLQESEILRDEIDRLRDECERQRRLLSQAESIFKR